jgi:hypothetical protein
MRAAVKLLALQNRNLRRIWALLCLSLFLGVALSASLPALHKAIHPDATSPNHQCVITSLAQGLLTVSALFVGAVAFVAALIFRPALLQETVCSLFDYRFAPSRAPPTS